MPCFIELLAYFKTNVGNKNAIMCVNHFNDTEQILK